VLNNFSSKTVPFMR